MAKIESFQNPSKKDFKNNPVKVILQSFLSLDNFTKGFIISIILIILATPFIINNLQIFSPGALETQTFEPSIPLGTTTLSGEKPLFAHYYPWYSSPPRTSNYRHWDGGQGGCGSTYCPPDDIKAGGYPFLGPYDSLDTGVLTQHMQWLKAAKVDVISTSWWGKASPEDNAVQKLMDTASLYGLKVNFTIEPYGGRTAASIVEDIKYIYSKYGSHPAFFRMVRPTLYGPSTSQRGVFFIYALSATSDVPPAFDSLRGTADDAILLARMNDGLMFTDANVRMAIGWVHTDGLYNYSTTEYKGTSPGSFPKSSDYLLIYSASPGFDSTRYNTSPVVQRENGAFYERGWQSLVNGQVEGVAILSFNEWHETTQIEPAKPFFSTRDNYTYQDYTGHLPVLPCSSESEKYLCATAKWAGLYKGAAAPTSVPAVTTPTPTRIPAPTSTPTPKSAYYPKTSPSRTPTPTPTSLRKLTITPAKPPPIDYYEPQSTGPNQNIPVTLITPTPPPAYGPTTPLGKGIGNCDIFCFFNKFFQTVQIELKKEMELFKSKNHL